MPRKKREISENKIYYIFQRSLEERKLCEKMEDFEVLTSLILSTVSDFGGKVYAFAVTKQELHILMKEKNQLDISLVMKEILSNFVSYRRKEGGFSGGLMKDRFKSVPTPDDKILETVRFIHQAPLRGKEIFHIDDYPFSSYKCYVNDDPKVATAEILEKLSPGRAEAFQKFKLYHATLETSDLKPKERSTLSEENVKKCIEEHLKMPLLELKTLEKKKKARLIKILKRETILSIRQISKALGMSRNTVSEIINHKETLTFDKF